MIAYVFLLLAIRSVILVWQEKKIFHYVTAALSLIFFLLLPGDFQWKPLAVIAAMIGVSLYRRLSQKNEKRLSYQNFLGFSFLYAFGTIAVLASFCFRLDEKKIGRVVLTGKTEQQWVEWKNPASKQLESAWMDAYEVVIEDHGGKELSRQLIYGDLVGVRAEIITIQWPFHLLGFSNLCHLEMVYNGYSTAKRHSFFPHQGYPLPFPIKGFQIVWGKLYRGDWKIPGIKNGALESAYYPLTTADLKPLEGSFFLFAGAL